MLGGELQNFSMTSAYMDTMWQKLVDTNISTILGCVTWEDIEPTEGIFEFEELEKVILGARSYGLHLVLLCFGSFKNGLSTYAPAWVKKDFQRFARAQLRKAGGILQTADVVSIFHKEVLEADTRAFAALMRHVKEIDEVYSNVILMQVENEVGLLGDSRDGSSAANKRFSEAVPRSLIDHLSEKWDTLHPTLRANLQEFEHFGLKTGTWEAVFGKSSRTDELFMAYHYSLYLNHVASGGKKEYPLPLYTNVWQNYVGDPSDSSLPIVVGGGGEPGVYPSGGAVSNVLEEFAQFLDFIAPDIYLNDYSSSCAEIAIWTNRSSSRNSDGMSTVHVEFGKQLEVTKLLVRFGIDILEPEMNLFTKHYKLLSQVKDIVLDAHRKPGSSIGFFFDELRDGRDTSPPTVTRFGDFEVTINRCFVFGKPGPGAGRLIYLGGAKFLLVGWGF